MIVGKPMKVILSIDPVRFPLTGIGRYTFELVKHLLLVIAVSPESRTSSLLYYNSTHLLNI